ncbi:MAG: hypothetical protein JWN44_2343 [Myxococcales bacterium]|nr:hypothetical protein [Myxococcales bacterium]
MRRTERFPVELPVIWNRAGREIHCNVVDVNEHGMYLATDEVVEHGALIRLKVKLPTRELEMFVTARFVGVTASGRGIGAEIFLIDDMSRCFWVAFYQELAASFTQQRQTAAVGG